jgi:hypothetical protein
VERYRTEAGKEDVVSTEDISLLRDYAKELDPNVRLTAIKILCDEAEDLTWEELEEWALDPDEKIRDWVLFRLSFGGELIESDRSRFMDILVRVKETYEASDVGNTFWSLAHNSDDWLDLTWNAAGRLIDLEREQITGSLCAGYVENVLTYLKLGPDDPRVKSWVDGDKSERKFVLLGVVEWLGFGEGRLREITEALSHDTDAEVAEFAKELIEREKILDRHEQKKTRKPGKPRWTESDKANKQEN